MIIRRDWPKVSPIARAASACPSGTVLMPGAQRLADEGRGVDRQPEHRQPEGVVCWTSAAEAESEGVAEAERGEAREQRQRRVPHDVDVERADRSQDRHRARPAWTARTCRGPATGPRRRPRAARSSKSPPAEPARIRSDHPSCSTSGTAAAGARRPGAGHCVELRAGRTRRRAREWAPRWAASALGLAEPTCPATARPGAVLDIFVMRVVDLLTGRGVALLQADAVALVGEEGRRRP